jgi:hypothetical protein
MVLYNTFYSEMNSQAVKFGILYPAEEGESEHINLVASWSDDPSAPFSYYE